MNNTTNTDTTDTRSLVFTLAITPDEFLRLYQGTVRNVVTKASNGQTVRFPANILRPFVTRDGVQGTFRISFDAKGKLTDIDKLG